MKKILALLAIGFGLSQATCQVGFLDQNDENSTLGTYIFKHKKSAKLSDNSNLRISLIFDSYAPLVITYDPQLNEQCSMPSKKPN
jgi:hypothetical protein